ncbi:hypothetical protein EGK63_03575 [Brevundimonas sp. 357]|nr:hypothetical protein EGK63_03575 [Brevundimonas sp. 357]
MTGLFPTAVILGLDPRIQPGRQPRHETLASARIRPERFWILGSSPRMTAKRGRAAQFAAA